MDGQIDLAKGGMSVEYPLYLNGRRVGVLQASAGAQTGADEADDWRAAAPGDVPSWRTEGGLFRRRGQVLELALPFDPAAPFPLPSLFCLARIRRLRGREWAVFRFTERGEPLAAEDACEKYER